MIVPKPVFSEEHEVHTFKISIPTGCRVITSVSEDESIFDQDGNVIFNAWQQAGKVLTIKVVPER